MFVLKSIKQPFTPTTLSITVRKDVQEIKPESIIGIDRNLRNIYHIHTATNHHV
ncbi:MAG: hypothetical protein ABI337_00805 [Nitrososphaera sp.]